MDGRISVEYQNCLRPGAIGVLGQEKARRVFLVTDPFFVKNGMADRVVRAAGAESWEIFDGVQPDPSVELAARGTAGSRPSARIC